MRVVLNRLCSDVSGVRGVLIFDRKVLCHTYELPWLGNVRYKSCIPVGSYPVRRVVSTRFGDCFRLDDVFGRSDILIHPGNSSADTQGCILPGLDVDDRGVVLSKGAMGRLLMTLPSEFILDIREV